MNHSRILAIAAAAMTALAGLFFAGTSAHAQQPAQGDTFSGSGGGQSFRIVSMDHGEEGPCDVKLWNPVTHYVHSVTIDCGALAAFAVNDWVRERRDKRGVTVALLPTNRATTAPSPAKNPSKQADAADRRPPPVDPVDGNLDPTKGPLQGGISNDPVDPLEPGPFQAPLQAINDAIGKIPGLADALQAGAQFTGEQRKEIEKAYDPTKPGMAPRAIFDALLSEPEALGVIAKAGGPAAAAAIRAGRDAMAQAVKAAGKKLGGAIEKAAAKTPLWTSTKSKTSVENAFGHWQKHRAEFPEFQNAKQYVEGTKSFFNNPPPGTLTKVKPNGDTLFYNPANNTFGVRAADGAPRTMFRPRKGMEYWNDQ